METDYPLCAEAACALVRQACLLDPAPAAMPMGEGSPDPAVLVMGAFDGLHLGHRALVEAALADAHARGVPCRPVMFDPDPSEVLHPDDSQGQLLSIAGRARGLRMLGCDEPIVLPFTPEFSRLSPAEFLTELFRLVRPLAIHVGSNFHFGHRGAGDVGTLRECARTMGFEPCVHELLMCGGSRVSSTRIRGLIAEPDRLGEATKLLGRCHFVSGSVEHGRGEGTGFGFPTANVRCDPRSCMPAEGVYGGYVVIDGAAWPAAINVGAPVSFTGPDERFLEANLIGFEGDVYGARVAVVFAKWLRAARRFDSLDELTEVVLENIAWVRDSLGAGCLEVAS